MIKKTKFYLGNDDLMRIDTQRKIFQFDNYWLANLTYEEIKVLTGLSFMFLESINFRYWEAKNDYENIIFEFLRRHHHFELIDYLPDKSEFGLNSFDLDEKSLMYIRLMQ